jgi:hypothetical protein
MGKEAVTSHVKIIITVSVETREREKLVRNTTFGITGRQKFSRF